MHELPLLVWLGRAEPTADDLLGGKAGALARLVANDEPVPRSAVLTTAAHAAVVATEPVRALACRLHGDDALPSDEEIDRTFLDVPLPDELHRVLTELSRGFDGPVAVRSSATAEDLAGAAFAGQYRTVLDVAPDEVEHAVRLVWASLWHAAPRAYRDLRGVTDRAPAMAVLVMEMIRPTRAGVLFTRDPVGDEANVRLEIVDGCGDALVSGAVTPDAHTWPRVDAVAASARLGPGVPELVERGLALEAAWGTPLDIEFALDETGRPWLVQARPVTTLAAGATETTTRAGIAEMLPGVLPPLLQATAGGQVDEGFRALLEGLGADLSVASSARFVRFERSRALLDLALLRRATATIPGGSVAALDRGYGAAPSTSTAPTRSTVGQIVRVMRRRREAVVESEIVVQAVERLVADDGGRDADDVRDLLARWERVHDLGVRTTSAEMAVAALATAAFEGVQHTLARHVDPERAGQLAQRLTSRPGGRGGPLDRCLRASGVDPSQPLTESTWSDVLAHAGSRSVFGGPTWADDAELAWAACTTGQLDAEHAAATPPASPDELLRTIRPVRPHPRLSRPRRRFVRREAADAAELLDRRERTKQALLDLGGIAHRATRQLAEHLVTTGVLTSTDDVWLLTPVELRAACVDGVVPDTLDERRDALAADRARTLLATMPTGDGHGWPASPGQASGRAVVVEAPRAGALRRGEVLVARTTDAGWAPLFAVAAAIVVEEGGPLSHASIVARELGVPAVVNVPGIVEQVRAAGPDAVVLVDGTTGTVTIAEPRPVLAEVIGPPDDEPRLGVFVTGLVGATALLGAVVSVTEAVSSARGIRRTRRHAAAPAAIVADVVRHGTSVVQRSVEGLAPATHYRRWSIALSTVGLLLAAVAVTRYAEAPSGDRIVWILTASSLLPAALWAALLAHRAATHWPDVPPLVRRVTPSPRPHTTLRERWREVPSAHRRWLVAFGSIAVGLLLLNLRAPDRLRAVDERLYDWFGAPDPDPWGPDWFGMYFGRPQIAVPIALLVALFTVRCRVLALAYPLTIMFGGLLNLGLGAIVDKDRPPLGAHADQTDSFPSGHAIEVTLLLGLAPLAIAVLLRSAWAGRIARVLATGILTVMLVDGLREGSHWPSDHLAGFAIAMTAVVLVHALARMSSLHGSCRRCPALTLHDDRTVTGPPGSLTGGQR